MKVSLSHITSRVLALAVGYQVLAAAAQTAQVSIQLGNTANNTTGFNQTIANTNSIGGTLLDFMALAQAIVARAVPLLIGAAVVIFFVGIIMFIFAQRKGEETKAAKGVLLWSVIALFVMVSVWGLVGFLGSILGVGQGGAVPIPQIPVAQ